MDQICYQRIISEHISLVYRLSMFFFAFLALSSSICTLPNTVEDFEGACVCEKGFVTDDSFLENGCWKCDRDCHVLAKCAYPGLCQCDAEFIGDGINECIMPFPELIKLNNEQLLSNGERLLTFGYKDMKQAVLMKIKVKSFYCKVGTLIIKANKFTSSEVQCQIPKKIKGNVNVSISYDSLNWSPQQIPVNIDDSVNIKEIQDAIPFLICLVVFMMIGIVAFYGKSLFFTLPSEEEVLIHENIPDEE